MKQYVPQSKYRKAKSTSGGEFVELESKKPYKGFYIELYDGRYLAGKTPEEDGVELVKESKLADQVKMLVGTAATIPGLLAGFFKKRPTQSEIENGATKRNFIQNKNNKKIIETDPETYKQANKGLVNSTFAQIDWIIKGPAQDQMFGNYPFEGAASKNKKTIQGLEKTMPGISTFITDYSYLVVEPVAAQPQDLTTQTFVEKDHNTQIQNDRKAHFDSRE